MIGVHARAHVAAVEHAEADGDAFDGFCGSASALVAARQLGVRMIGAEIDGRWIGPAVQRLRQTEIPVRDPAPKLSGTLALPDLEPGPGSASADETAEDGGATADA